MHLLQFSSSRIPIGGVVCTPIITTTVDVSHQFHPRLSGNVYETPSCFTITYPYINFLTGKRHPAV